MDIMQRAHPEALYYHIAGDALEKAKTVEDEFERAECVCTSMVFSALTLEAFINQQYAAHKETEDIDLRTLDIKNKWLMLPRLLGAKQSFKTDTEPFQTMSRLIRFRNEVLVHFKPGLDATPTKGKRIPFSQLVKDAILAQQFFECIPKMIQSLRELTSGQVEGPEGFLNGARYISTISVSFPLVAEAMLKMADGEHGEQEEE